MSALVIILLSTVLIQRSSIALGAAPTSADPSLRAEFREAAFIVVSITISATFGYAITRYVLMPLQLEYMRVPALVLLTALIIVATRSIITGQDDDPAHKVLAVMTNQCALLGVVLFVSYHVDTLFESFLYGFGSALSLSVLDVAFKSMMERVDSNSVPFVFRGIPISLITAGLMALALMGYAGIVRN